jgi:hypothetical protein
MQQQNILKTLRMYTTLIQKRRRKTKKSCTEPLKLGAVPPLWTQSPRSPKKSGATERAMTSRATAKLHQKIAPTLMPQHIYPKLSILPPLNIIFKILVIIEFKT